MTACWLEMGSRRDQAVSFPGSRIVLGQDFIVLHRPGGWGRQKKKKQNMLRANILA